MWTLAWRNLWRNRTRTVILGSAIALTYAMMLLSIGMADDMHTRMKEAARKVAGGQVLIHGEGYWNRRSTEITVPHPDTLRSRIEGLPDVKVVIPRVIGDGLLKSTAGNAPLQLYGIDPAREKVLEDPGRYLTEGDFLDGPHGPPLALGSGVVGRLNAEVGDKLVLTAPDADGELTRGLFRLGGVLESGSRQLDETLGYTTLSHARDVLNMEGRLTQLGVLGVGSIGSEPLKRRITSHLRDHRDHLEVMTWQEAMPEMVGFIQIDNAFTYVYVIVIFLIVTLSITNTFLMSVKERVGELGLLSALGFNDARIARMILAETVLLAALTMLSGLGLGLLGHAALNEWGLDLTLFMDRGIEVSGVTMSDMVAHSEIRPFKWILASAGVLAAIVLSALYPVWRAIRLAPAQALQVGE